MTTVARTLDGPWTTTTRRRTVATSEGLLDEEAMADAWTAAQETLQSDGADGTDASRISDAERMLATMVIMLVQDARAARQRIASLEGEREAWAWMERRVVGISVRDTEGRVFDYSLNPHTGDDVFPTLVANVRALFADEDHATPAAREGE